MGKIRSTERKFLIALVFFIPLLISCNSSPEKVTEQLVEFKQEDTVACVVADPALDRKGKRVKQYFEEFISNRRFNGTILVSQGNYVLYKEAVGYANFESKTPLSTSTQFQLASVSKQFTATAIIILKERGMLDYDDDVTKFFPDFPYSGISVRNLLTHSSGLPNYTYFCDVVCKDKERPLTNFDVIRIMKESRQGIYFKPGRRFDYSNTGYCVLAAIVEKLSNQKFEDFVKKNIFEKAGMKSSFVYSKCSDVDLSNTAYGYEGRRRVAYNFLNGVTGDKGVYSTVEDLFKWHLALNSGLVISKESLETAFTPQHKRYFRGTNYGFGWRIANAVDDNSKIIYHAGWWQGFKSCFVSYRKNNCGVFILSNVTHRNFTMEDIQELGKILLQDESK